MQNVLTEISKLAELLRNDLNFQCIFEYRACEREKERELFDILEYLFWCN